MKSILVRILLIIWCIVMCLGLFACSQTDEIADNATNDTTPETTDDNDPYTFESVQDLKLAIKKNPEMYENKQVTVKGSILKTEGQVIVSDAAPLHVGDTYNGSSLMAEREFRQEANAKPNIGIVMSKDNMSTLLDSGDYVKIIGVVTITNFSVYLNNCTYEMIKSIYE